MNDILALALFFLLGYIASRVMNFLRVPSVVGYVLLGLLLGPAVTNIVSDEVLRDLDFISYIALGFVAFVIGSRIKIADFKKLKEHIVFLTIFQALMTFAFVFSVVYLVGGGTIIALLLAAIATATAPASMFSIVEEYKAKGPLTKTLLAIVALDDAICIILFGVIAAFILVITGNSLPSSWHIVARSFLQILESVGIGALIGLSIHAIAKMNGNNGKGTYIGVSLILLGSGISLALDISVLLTNMVAGCLIANTFKGMKRFFNAVEHIEEIIIILFFTLAGAHLQITLIPHVWPLLLAFTLAFFLVWSPEFL